MAPIRKIVLVEPKAPGNHVYSRVALPRLGLPMLAALLKRAGYHDVKVYCETLSSVPREDLLSADLVGLSTTTSTAIGAYRIGSFVKKHNPKATVVIGGVHATFLPEESFDPAFCAKHGLTMPVCDHVMRGEGEDLIVPLVQAIEDGSPPEPVVGRRLRSSFADRIDNHCVVQDLDSLPFPDLDCIVGRERMRIVPITTSRGCPFDCTFCSVIEMFGQHMRYRSIEPDDPCSVIEEMRRLNVGGRRNVFFYDDNFNANTKRTKQLLENMLRASVVPKMWTAQVRATEVVRDRELLKLMQRTNCTMVYVGLESVNPLTLKEYNKRQSVEQITESIAVLREYGIRTHGMFVVGGDEDTVETVRATADFSIENDISTVQLMILTPLPGTRYFENLRAEGRLFDENWTNYDAHHTVFLPKHMSPRELQVETLNAMARVFRIGRGIMPMLRGNFQTGYFRLYAHKMVANHVRATREYVANLPRLCWQPSSAPSALPVG